MITIRQRNEIISYIREASKRLVEAGLPVEPEIVFGGCNYSMDCSIKIYTECGNRYHDFIYLCGFDEIFDEAGNAENGMKDVKEYIDYHINLFIDFNLNDLNRWKYQSVNSLENFLEKLVSELNHYDNTLTAKFHVASKGHYYITMNDIAGNECATISYGTNLERLYDRLNKSMHLLSKFVATYTVDAFIDLYGCEYDEAFGGNAFVNEYYDSNIFSIYDL